MTAARILVIAEGDIVSTELLMQVLRAARPFGIEPEQVLREDWTDPTLPGGVTPLFIRCGDPSMLPYAEALVARKRPCLYYIDDDFWAIDKETPLGRYYGHPGVQAALDYFTTHAALVLTNTPALADVLRRRGATVAVVPTFFSFELIRDVASEATGEIRIGFAGSLGRVVDLELVAPSIATILASDPRVVVRVRRHHAGRDQRRRSHPLLPARRGLRPLHRLSGVPQLVDRPRPAARQ